MCTQDFFPKIFLFSSFYLLKSAFSEVCHACSLGIIISASFSNFSHCFPASGTHIKIDKNSHVNLIDFHKTNWNMIGDLWSWAPPTVKNKLSIPPRQLIHYREPRDSRWLAPRHPSFDSEPITYSWYLLANSSTDGNIAHWCAYTTEIAMYIATRQTVGNFSIPRLSIYLLPVIENIDT